MPRDCDDTTYETRLHLRPLAEGEGDALDIWAAHSGVSRADATTALPPGAPLHEEATLARLCTAIAGMPPSRCALIYTHTGAQPDYRTPLLQSLLAALPSFGAVVGFRAEGPGISASARMLARAYLDAFDTVLIVADSRSRLVAGNEAGPGEVLHHVLTRPYPFTEPATSDPIPTHAAAPDCLRPEPREATP